MVFKKFTSMENKKLPFGLVIMGMMKQFMRVLKKQMLEVNEDSTVEQMGLLIAVSNEHKDVIQQDMADILGKDKSSILRSIDLLEKRGLLQRLKDPNDRRKNIINITQLGIDTLNQHFEMERQLTESLVEGISETELKNFFTVIERIKSNAEKL